MSNDLEAVLTDWPTLFLKIKATLEVDNITIWGSRGLSNFNMFL